MGSVAELRVGLAIAGNADGPLGDRILATLHFSRSISLTGEWERGLLERHGGPSLP
jgi:hypothetical protein